MELGLTNSFYVCDDFCVFDRAKIDKRVEYILKKLLENKTKLKSSEHSTYNFRYYQSQTFFKFYPA